MTNLEWSLSKNKPYQIVAGIEDINECIEAIVTTVKGSDPYRPDFGCSLYEHMDKPLDVSIPNMIHEIGKSIAEFEPRAKVKNISYKLEQGKIIFSVYWSSDYGDNNTIIEV